MDCKLKICALMKEIKTIKAKSLENQLLEAGIEKTVIVKALKTLQERGVIYRKRGGIIEFTDSTANRIQYN